MQIIKYLFEGFFIALMGSYLIGQPIKADDIVIMASAIAVMLMISDSFGPIYTYIKMKIFLTFHKAEAQFGGYMEQALHLQNALQQQTGGMDGTMSLQTALQMQKMLRPQDGGMDGTMSLQTAQQMQKMLKRKARQTGGCDEKMKNKSTWSANGNGGLNASDAYGDYANYATAYNIPEMPVSNKELDTLEEENKLPRVNFDRIEHQINKRRFQSGGAPDSKNAKNYLFNMDLVNLADTTGKKMSLDASGTVILAADKPINKLRFELVDDNKAELVAINYSQPVYLVFNDPVTHEKGMVNYDGKLNTTKNKTQIKYILIDSTTPANRGPVDITKPVLLKTVIGNKYLSVKGDNIMEGAAEGAPFKVLTARGCGPLWVFDETAKQSYTAGQN
jgi:hypothetical protein